MKKTKTETKKVTEEVKKDPRASETREATKRPVEWTPPSSLDAPPAPDGFRHRWIRAESLGFDDTKNIVEILKKKFPIYVQLMIYYQNFYILTVSFLCLQFQTQTKI